MKLHKETIRNIDNTDLVGLMNEWYTMWINHENEKITNKEYLDWMKENITSKGFEGQTDSFTGKPISLYACLIS